MPDSGVPVGESGSPGIPGGLGCGRAAPRLRRVVLLDDAGKDELIAVARHRPDEPQRARVFAERAAERAHGLAQRAVADDDVGPGLIDDLAPVDRFVPALDEEDEHVEVTRDDRHLGPATQQKPAPRRDDELAEAVAGPGHGRPVRGKAVRHGSNGPSPSSRPEVTPA